MKTVLLLVAALVLAQDAPPPSPTPAPPAPAEKKPVACDLAKVAPCDHCPKCRTFLLPKDLAKGACRRCGSKPEKVDGCVKTSYSCRMHPGRQHRKACCATPGCCLEKVVIGHVQFKCDKCSAVGPSEKEVVHSVEKCDGKPARVCEHSGKFPHGGEEK